MQYHLLQRAFSFLFFFFLLIFLNLFIFNWRIIALQYYVGFCHTSTWISNCLFTKSCPTLWPHGLQDTRLPCPSLSPWVCSNSCPLSQLMPSNHFILCHPLLLPSVFASIRVFSSELALRIRWPKYRSFSTSPSNDYAGLIAFRIDWFHLLESLQGLSRVFSGTTIWKHQFSGAQPSLWSNSYIWKWLPENHSFDYADLCQQSDASAF